MSLPIRILAVTVIAFGGLSLPGPSHAVGQPRVELTRPELKHHHGQPARSKPGEENPSREIAPNPKSEGEKPSAPDGKPSEKESLPDEDEEVSPGDSPASCDGCELAGFALSGSLWGLFGVRKRRGVHRTVIRGFQPR